MVRTGFWELEIRGRILRVVHDRIDRLDAEQDEVIRVHAIIHRAHEHLVLVPLAALAQ